RGHARGSAERLATERQALEGQQFEEQKRKNKEAEQRAKQEDELNRAISGLNLQFKLHELNKELPQPTTSLPAGQAGPPAPTETAPSIFDLTPFGGEKIS